MIVDLNLKGKQVLVVGGGKEAARKVEGLLSQDCEIIVISEWVCDEIERHAQAGKIALKKSTVKDGDVLKEYDRLILVMVLTDNTELNRKIAQAARALPCYAYCVDDPEYSDFGHPAVINLSDTVQVAISTGGRSPLMAKSIRQKAEPVLKDLIGNEDILQIRLQEAMRNEAKQILSTPNDRKRFLEIVHSDKEIRELLAQGKADEAKSLALDRLKNFSS